MLKYEEVKHMLKPSTDCVQGNWTCVLKADNHFSREAGLGIFSYHVTKADAEHNALILDGIALPAEAGERIAQDEILDNFKV
jgi:hypothetical protein